MLAGQSSDQEAGRETSNSYAGPSHAPAKARCLGTVRTDYGQGDPCYVLHLAQTPERPVVAAALSTRTVKLFSLECVVLLGQGNNIYCRGRDRGLGPSCRAPQLWQDFAQWVWVLRDLCSISADNVPLSVHCYPCDPVLCARMCATPTGPIMALSMYSALLAIRRVAQSRTTHGRRSSVIRPWTCL